MGAIFLRSTVWHIYARKGGSSVPRNLLLAVSCNLLAVPSETGMLETAVEQMWHIPDSQDQHFAFASGESQGQLPRASPLHSSICHTPHHTVEYDPFIQSQLASIQLTLRPYLVQLW